MKPDYGARVASAWEQVMRESPVNDTGYIYGRLTGHRYTYREVLDRRRHNVYGDVIPWMVLVRRNLRQMGRPASWPPRLPS